MIELVETAVRLGRFALGPLSLRVERGEQLLVLGPSGAGKSVLLELVAGFVRPQRGTIRLRGCDVTAWPPHKRRCAWMAQADTVFPHMSVGRNIEYGLRGTGLSLAQRRSRAAAMAERLGIAALLQRTPPTLSGGERQRVALARALVTGCDILLLDEPFSAVDRGRRLLLRSLVAELQREMQLTVVQVTHDPEALVAGDARALVLVNGRVAQLAEAARVVSSPASLAVAEALGMNNRLSAEVRGNALHWEGARAPLPSDSDLSDGPVWLCAAAQDVLLQRADAGVGPTSSAGRLATDAVVEGLRSALDTWRIELRLPSGERLTASCAPRPELGVGARVRVELQEATVQVRARVGGAPELVVPPATPVPQTLGLGTVAGYSES